MQPLCQRLADELGQNLHLGSPVLSIHQIDQAVIVRTNHQEYTAQRVILAIPPILAGDITYEPALPIQRHQLTKNMPMGSVIKYVAVYDRPFWREKGFSGEAFSDAGCVTTFDGCTSTGTPALVTFSDSAVARDTLPKLPMSESRRCLSSSLNCSAPRLFSL